MMIALPAVLVPRKNVPLGPMLFKVGRFEELSTIPAPSILKISLNIKQVGAPGIELERTNRRA